MSFTSLGYLWSFLFIAPLILVYLLKVKPVKKITAAFFLWEEIIDQKKASQLFHKLKDLFSLLILLLAFLLFCTALLDPVSVHEEENKDLLLLIDNSLSMSALEKSDSRMGLAKEKANQIIKGMGLNRSAVLATVSNQILYVVDKTNNLTLLKEGVGNINCSKNGLDTKIFEEMSDNSSILENYRVILLTDGCHERLNQFKFVEIIKIGEPIDNIGITGFDIQRLPGGDNPAGIYIKLFNSSTKETDVEIKLAHQTKENLFKIIRITLKVGFNEPYTEAFKNVPSGKWIASVVGKDALLEDNIAYAMLPEFEPVKVQIKSENKDYFLTRCIKAFEDFKNHFVIVDQNPDILLTDNQENALGSTKPVVLFGVQEDSKFWQISNKDLMSPLLLSEATQNHRTMRYMKPETLKLKDCKNISLPKGVLPILVAENQNPILFKVSEVNYKIVVLNFDVHSSDFFLNINFPIMIHNICLDLVNKSEDIPVSYQVGDFVYFPSAVPSLKIISPTEISNEDIGQSFGPLDEKGFYRLENGAKASLLAVGVSPAFESNLNNAKVNTTLQPISSGFPIAYFLIFFAIALVVIELILYHRRKVS